MEKGILLHREKRKIKKGKYTNFISTIMKKFGSVAALLSPL